MYTNPEKKALKYKQCHGGNSKKKRIEKEIDLPNSKKTIAFTRKWHIIDNTVS